MKRCTVLAALLLSVALVVPGGHAAAQTQLIGDKDCFGFGAYPCSELTDITLGVDRRSASEAAAANGAQQTDFYSSNFSPLPTIFDVIFPLSTNIFSAALKVGMWGFQSGDLSAYTVWLNGVMLPNFFFFQDGPYAVVERTFNFNAAQIAAMNGDGELRLTIDRGTSIDATGFDYFQLDYGMDTGNGTGTVPEPATVVLLLSGLLGLGFVARRRGADTA